MYDDDESSKHFIHETENSPPSSGFEGIIFVNDKKMMSIETVHNNGSTSYYCVYILNNKKRGSAQ